MQVIERPVVKCPHCGLTQFLPQSDDCRKCKKPIQQLIPMPEVIPIVRTVAKQRAETTGELIARRIADIRIAKGISQKSLARKMKVPRTYVSKVETLKCVPYLKAFDGFAAGLGVSVLDLMTTIQTPKETARWSMARGGDDEEVMAALIEALPHLQRRERSFLIACARKLATSRTRIFPEWMKVA